MTTRLLLVLCVCCTLLSGALPVAARDMTNTPDPGLTRTPINPATIAASNTIRVYLPLALGAGEPPEIPAIAFPSAPVIDGVLQEWGSVPATLLDDQRAASHGGPQPHPTPADLSVTLRAGWRSNTLYFAATVTDDAIIGNDSVKRWEDDDLEIGIQIGGHTRQFALIADGRRAELLDGGAERTPDIDYLLAGIPGGWVLEVAIPAAELGVGMLSANETFPFTFGYWDDDDGGAGDSHLILWGTSTNSHSEEWGTIRLVP